MILYIIAGVYQNPYWGWLLSRGTSNERVSRITLWWWCLLPSVRLTVSQHRFRQACCCLYNVHLKMPTAILSREINNHWSYLPLVFVFHFNIHFVFRDRTNGNRLRSDKIGLDLHFRKPWRVHYQAVTEALLILGLHPGNSSITPRPAKRDTGWARDDADTSRFVICFVSKTSIH